MTVLWLKWGGAGVPVEEGERSEDREHGASVKMVEESLGFDEDVEDEVRDTMNTKKDSLTESELRRNATAPYTYLHPSQLPVADFHKKVVREMDDK